MRKISYILFLISVFNPNFAYSQNQKINNNTNKITGNIFIGENPLPSGEIFILKETEEIKGNGYHLRNKKVRNGKFTFVDVNADKLLIYVIPELDCEDLYYPKYIPTYLGNSHSWEKASFFNLQKSNYRVNFSLISYPDPFYGNKKISGKIYFKEDFLNSKTDYPVTLILLNEMSVPMDFRKIDKTTGIFSFDNLPEGTYYLHPEIPGLKSSDLKITLNDNAQNIEFKVTKESVFAEKNTDDILPVVSNNYVRIYLQDDTKYPVVCELIDLSGKTATKKIYNTDNITVNTSRLASGIYILKVKTFDNSPVKTAKVFIRNY